MTYNEKVTIIQGICESINAAGTFVHGRNSDGSIEFKGKMPQIHLYPFTTSKNTETGFETSEMLMGFWFQDSLSTTPKQRQEIIAKADDLCNKFISGIAATGVIRMENVRTEPQYRTLSGTLSGYALRFNFTSQSPIGC